MDKVAVVVRDPEDLIKIKKQLVDFEYSEDPDFVVSFGGDGTFLVSERQYPGIPKLIVRKGSSVCDKCAKGDIYHLISKILKEDYTLEEHLKIEAVFHDRILTATNDVVFRNKWPTHAVRFRVWVDQKQVGNVIIGDGVVVSTPIGSTGYHESITRKSFEKGIGLAFNNTTRKYRHRVIDEQSEVEIELVRGNAVVAVDNNPEIIDVFEEERILVRKSQQKIRIIGGLE